MALKAILDSIDDLPEDVKSEYTKKKVGDKEVFVLDVEGIAAHPDAAALKVALDRQKQDNKKLKDEKTALETKLKDFPDEFTIDEWHRLQALDIDDEDEDGKKKKKAKEDERLTAMKAQMQAQIDAGKAALATLQTKYDTDVNSERTGRATDKAERDLTDALITVGVKTELMDGARAVLAKSIKHEIEDGAVRTFVQTDLGEVEVSAYVDAWAKSDKGKAYLAPATGGGAEGKKVNGNVNIADNPFHHTFWNKTKQGQLYNADRNKAERLARAAGFASLEAAVKATAPLKPAA